ncbi:hypothetical protein SDJN02_27526, partial [Cucurbita argyrosperma subsp. argyrosperma]
NLAAVSTFANRRNILATYYNAASELLNLVIRQKEGSNLQMLRRWTWLRKSNGFEEAIVKSSPKAIEIIRRKFMKPIFLIEPEIDWCSQFILTQLETMRMVLPLSLRDSFNSVTEVWFNGSRGKKLYGSAILRFDKEIS